MAEAACVHDRIECLNHYEMFRKHRCLDCGRAYICACERMLAEVFLPHQIGFAQDGETGERVPTDGFSAGLCAACRGEQESVHPRAAIWGQKGKVERYYWREIRKTYYELLLDKIGVGADQQSILSYKRNHSETCAALKKQAKQQWQGIHQTQPKYNLKERTEAEFLSTVAIDIRELRADYRQVQRDGQKIGRWSVRPGELGSVEEFVTAWFGSGGYEVLRCERTLISAWVATFLGVPIQDPADPRSQEVMRGSTVGWTPQHRDTPLIRFRLPRDFGRPNYYKRRRDILESWFIGMRVAERLETLFDMLLDETELIRDYLWVADPASVARARRALQLLPREVVVCSVEWAIGDFWQRQPGWPDLLVVRDGEYRFVEVKSPHDELSQEQMRWFQWALSQNVSCEITRVKYLREGEAASRAGMSPASSPGT
jgi:hypothetical protein